MMTNSNINERIWELYQEYEVIRDVQKAINSELGTDYSYDTIQGRIYRMKQKHEESFENFEVVHVRNVEDTLEMTPYERFLADSGMNLDEFQVKAGSVWGTGNGLSFSAKWERKPASYEEMFTQLSDAFRGNYRQTKLPNITSSDQPLLAVLGMADAHVGKLAVHEGVNPYYLYRQVIIEFIDEFERRNYNIEKFVYIVGNDLRHFDNPHYTTTQGTQLDPSMHWTDSIDKTVEILQWSTTMLAENIAPVDVHIVQGNHDQESMYWAGTVLDAYFHRADSIKIHNPKLGRQYAKWKQLGMLMAHGSDEKKPDLGWTFASENPKLWGETTKHVAFTGHLHGIEISEKNGFMTIQFPALSETDEWHKRKTFDGNERSGLALLFREDGRLHEVKQGYGLK